MRYRLRHGVPPQRSGAALLLSAERRFPLRVMSPVRAFLSIRTGPPPSSRFAADLRVCYDRLREQGRGSDTKLARCRDFRGMAFDLRVTCGSRPSAALADGGPAHLTGSGHAVEATAPRSVPDAQRSPPASRVLQGQRKRRRSACLFRCLPGLGPRRSVVSAPQRAKQWPQKPQPPVPAAWPGSYTSSVRLVVRSPSSW